MRVRLLAAPLAAAALVAVPPRISSAADPEPSTPADAAPAQPAPAQAAPAGSTADQQPAPPAGDGHGMTEEIVVTATRTPRPVRDVHAAVTVLPRTEIDRSPAKTSDELLRIDPSYGLFRRSSSVGADPSSQGVNLRGVGPSGVSRALVLRDGIPVNDPFGGWVYWRTLPTLGIGRIELVPGGGSALYGNYALGGVIQVLSRPITPATLDALVEGGSFDTVRATAFGSHREGPIGVAIDTELFRSSGYPVVADYARGPIDKNTPSWHAVVNARLEAQATEDLSFGARGGFFYEDFNGGTQYTTAMVRQWEYAFSARYAPASVGTFDLSLFGHKGDFKQDRARVNADRSQESLSGRQDVPTHDFGAGLLWTSRPLPLAGKHTLSVGADARRITGETYEHIYPATVTPTSVVLRDANGEQLLYGVFAQEVWDVVDALSLSAAVRYDKWLNLNASRVDTLSNGTQVPTPFADRNEDQVTPKFGLRLRPIDWLTLRAQAYKSFRAPTLNELYRPFQVGTIVTAANENLTAETLKGAEAGVEFALPRGATARVTGFWNVLQNPIVNVTTPQTAPNRVRQNLGEARIRGIETDAGWRFAPSWIATAAYTFVDNRVTDAPGQPQLVGKELPQDPRHRASASLAFDAARFLTASVQFRYIGAQYEDDLNTLKMGEVFLFDVFASWHALPFLDVFAAVENILDRTYLVGRSGVDTIGQPRFVHGGVRFRTGT